MSATTTVRVASFDELDASTLYALLRLRVDVFVVEQDCPYSELDGRDTEPTARHLWTTDADGPTAYLRVLRDPDGRARIGRVVVAPRARGTGLAGDLMRGALAEIGDTPSVLNAQAHLVDFYAKHGYAASGPEYLEDNIPHVPMARPAVTSATRD